MPDTASHRVGFHLDLVEASQAAPSLAALLPALPMGAGFFPHVRIRLDASLEEAERKFFLAVLDKHQGDKRATAAQLGISLKCVYNKLERWGIHRRIAERS